MNENESKWRELQERKDEFLHILRILNHYYEMRGETKTERFRFREKLVKMDPNEIQIFFSKLGTYEYQVACATKKNPKLESWIHIDGIDEERARMSAVGKMDHPVFTLVCLGDLYQTAKDTDLPLF